MKKKKVFWGKIQTVFFQVGYKEAELIWQEIKHNPNIVSNEEQPLERKKKQVLFEEKEKQFLSTEK